MTVIYGHLQQTACKQILLYCPYKNENSCNIVMGSNNTEIEIKVPEEYEYGYLDLECSANDSLSCTDSILVSCDPDHKKTETALL